jgi:hypothetical protein
VHIVNTILLGIGAVAKHRGLRRGRRVVQYLVVRRTQQQGYRKGIASKATFIVLIICLFEFAGFSEVVL